MIEKFFFAVLIIMLIVIIAWININLFLIALRLWPIWLVMLIIGVFVSVFSDKN